MRQMQVHVLKLPDVLFSREVRCYLIRDDPITLIDTGPNTCEALKSLERGLARIHLRLEDIRRVVITHSHPDHCGLLNIIRQRSGASVLASKSIKPWIEDYRNQWNKETLKIMKLFEDYEVPRSYVAVVMMMVRQRRKLGCADRVNAGLEPGDTLRFANSELRIVSTPGHSYWCISLFEPTSRILFCGDLLIENMIAQPFMQPTPENPGEWPNQIDMIQESLKNIPLLDPALAYPGHGPPVSSIKTFSDRIVQTHLSKQTRILEILKLGSSRLFEINRLLNTFKTPPEQLVELFETLHHLTCLCRKGYVRKDGARFSLV